MNTQVFNDMLGVIVPAVVGLVSSVTTYLVAKSGNSKDVTLTQRSSLSEDEISFRSELKEMINAQKVELEGARNEIKELRKEVADLHKTNLTLTLENRTLQEKVDEFALENKNLQEKVDELKTELQHFRRKGSK